MKTISILKIQKNYLLETSKNGILDNISLFWKVKINLVKSLKMKPEQLYTVTTTKHFQINQLFSITTNKDSYSEGQNVELTLGSSADDITVTVSIEKNEDIIKTFIIPLSNNKKTIAIPVTKDDIGGFAIHYSYAAFNSFSSSSLQINVPYPKSDLEIETSTFRDKLEPGTDETWSFKIKGPKGEKVTAEILASMYDMSLDQFKPHSWSFNPIQKPNYYPRIGPSARQSFGVGGFRVFDQQESYPNYYRQQYDQFNWFGFYFGNGYRYRYDIQMMEDDAVLDEVVVVGFSSKSKDELTSAVANVRAESISEDKLGMADIVKNERVEDNSEISNKGDQKIENIKVRKNLQETAFFFPQLETDAEGHVSFKFTTPEALTKWKLQLLSHTKTMESAVSSLESVTQKELMVIPNTPRFLREGDIVAMSTKIVNLTDKQLTGKAKLILTDAITGEDITQRT